jgi:hypothetical protein
MGRTIATLAFLSAAACGAIVACSSAERAPVALSNTGGGDGGGGQADTGTTPSDANAPDGNGGGTCVLTLSGARSGTFPCKAHAFASRAGGYFIQVDTVINMDPNVPTSLTKTMGFRCNVGTGALEVGTYTTSCYGGAGEATVNDAGQPVQITGWEGPATIRIDTLTLDTAAAATDAGTSYLITGSGESTAPSVYDAGDGTLKIVATF